MMQDLKFPDFHRLVLTQQIPIPYEDLFRRVPKATTNNFGKKKGPHQQQNQHQEQQHQQNQHRQHQQNQQHQPQQNKKKQKQKQFTDNDDEE